MEVALNRLEWRVDGLKLIDPCGGLRDPVEFKVQRGSVRVP